MISQKNVSLIRTMRRPNVFEFGRGDREQIIGFIIYL